jgi:hypothetical protein
MLAGDQTKEPMKHDYTAFDAKLMDLIHLGTNTAVALSVALEQDAKQFQQTTSPFPCPAFRVVDKRLQALRKSRQIAFRGGAWVLE